MNTETWHTEGNITHESHLADLVQQNLAAVRSEVLHSRQGFAENLHEAALHRQQGLLLGLFPLASTRCFFGRGLGGSLSPGEGNGRQRFSVFSLKRSRRKQSLNKETVGFLGCSLLVRNQSRNVVIIRSYKAVLSDLEVVMQHLLAVEQIRAGLTQITQVHLQRGDREMHTEVSLGLRHQCSR